MYNYPIYVYNNTQIGAKSQYKDTQMNTGERLKQVMEVKGFNLKTFSEQADIPYRTLQNYILSGREPNAEALMKLHTRLGVNLNWLVSGNGEMYTSEQNISLNVEESELLNQYRTINESGKRILKTTSQAILNELKNTQER